MIPERALGQGGRPRSLTEELDIGTPRSCYPSFDLAPEKMQGIEPSAGLNYREQQISEVRRGGRQDAHPVTRADAQLHQRPGQAVGVLQQLGEADLVVLMDYGRFVAANGACIAE